MANDRSAVTVRKSPSMGHFGINRSSTAPRTGNSLGICLLVLAITAGAVYAWQWKFAGPLAAPHEPASASVVIRWPAEYRDAAGVARPIVAPDPQLLTQELTSAANVRQALEDVPVAPAAAGDGLAELVAETRRKLQVTAQTAPGAHEVHITITCAVDGAHSATVVNGLAQHYADQCRTKLQIDAEQVLQSAHGAHQRARQRATAAKTAMDEYLNDALRQRAAADDAGQSPERPLNKTPGAANSPSDREAGPQATAAGHELRLTNNPQWATLNDQLQSLRSRRTELLATRTPLHPEIRDVDSHIIQVEEQLASTRRQIVDKLADLPVIINGSVQSSIVHPATATRKAVAAPRRIAENAEATETYHKLSDALAQANAAVEQAAAAESQARQEQTQLPLIEILPANMAATASPQLAVLLAPLRLALAAGLAMALGAGLLLRGMPPPRTFVTANQVQRALSLPVIGVLHESGAAAIASRSALHVAASLLCLALGMLIVAGCGLLMAGQIDHLASYVPWDLHPVTEPMHRFVDILSQKP